MRLMIGILLTLAGGAVVVTGIVGALWELIGLYSSALNNAMAEGPEAKAVGANMMRWAIVGGVGVPFLLVGSVLLKISLFQRLAARGKRTGGGLDRSAPARMGGPPGARKPEPSQSGKSATVTGQRAEPRVSPQGTPRRSEMGESGGNKSER